MLAAAIWALTPALPTQAQQPATAPAALIARGAYVARAGDCTACHRSPSGSPFAGGMPIGSGFGDIIGRNITPSRAFGIGTWSFADFDRAMRRGVGPAGDHLYPAMPYTAYEGMSADDMQALYAYFQKGVAPVDVATRETALSFPFNIRGIMVGWNMLFRPTGPFIAQLGAPDVQRGQYLVQTLGHCSACHSARNVLQGEETLHALGGGTVDGWYAPNITSDPVSGIGGWRRAELATYLKTGRVAGKGGAGGGMSDAVERSTRFLSDADLAAIAGYLKTVPAVHDAREQQVSFSWTQPRGTSFDSERAIPRGAGALIDSRTTDGAQLYDGACAACHGVDGRGSRQGRYFPVLVGSSTAGSIRPDNLVMTILKGVSRQSAAGTVQMPAFASMNDAQVAAIANYVTARFGNPATIVSTAAVAEFRAGGPRPLIVRGLPYVYGLATLIAAGIVVLVVRSRRPPTRKVPGISPASR